MINNGNMIICNKKDAEAYGFVIEGEVAFVWDLPVGAVCLGYNSMNNEWQADTLDPDTIFPYQMTGNDLHDMIDACNKLSTTMNNFHKNKSFREICEFCNFKNV